MTPTHDRIQLLAKACQDPSLIRFMGNISASDLSAWLDTELGHPDALDQFSPHGPLLSKATAPNTLLHIVSGNTPHAAFQSLLRGILLGSHNLIKLPSVGLPDLTDWIARLPETLQKMVETCETLTPDQQRKADAVIAIGSDDTIAAIQQQILPHQVFIPHGHKISIGIIDGDLQNAAPLAARDASLYNQRGCLSPHAYYVDESDPSHRGDALKFAESLATEMENFSQTNAPEPLNISEAGAVRNLRETTRFAATNSDSTRLWESTDNLDWTVIYQASPTLNLSCLNRCIYVKPKPTELNHHTLGNEVQHLSTIAIHPFSTATAQQLSSLPAHRICPLGQSQNPSIFWHQDGFAPLASLVKWQDLG
ncbi:MAG: hypothetical protein KJO21_05010 [Verrucomicrobiae bacterium]|nr:hypothetical protein [Verrucomicrobiae bacterium]NNJ43083.1 hypothetical protein [Akkermansiaceae bacterium]